MREIFIGDIHGCSGAFDRILERIDPDRTDRIILMGDLFDRGPDSFGVFERVRELDRQWGERLILLRGNHEDYLLAEKLSLSRRMVWERVGRGSTARSFRAHGASMEDARPFLQARCRLFWKGEGIQAVHAGIRVDPIEANDTETMIHDHETVLRNGYAGPLTVTGHIAIEIPTWFTGDGTRTEMLPPGEWLPLPETGVLCIDTGCGKGGRLTAMIRENGLFRLESTEENRF